MLKLSLMLILGCVVVERTVKRCEGKSKDLVVRSVKNRSNWSGNEEFLFSKLTGKGHMRTIPHCVRGENRTADPNFGEKTASQFRSLKKYHRNLTEQILGIQVILQQGII